MVSAVTFVCAVEYLMNQMIDENCYLDSTKNRVITHHVNQRRLTEGCARGHCVALHSFHAAKDVGPVP